MFLFGSNFAPLALDEDVPKSEWERMIAQMSELGFTAYRVFVPWNRIELEEGTRDFSDLDLSLQLADRHGLKVTVNVGGIFGNLQGYRPPAWLVHKYRCQPRVENPSAPPVPGTIDAFICNDDPIYLEKAEEFMRDVVKRYASHPALECWAVWNEPAGNACYCPHTMRLFQDWLRTKYSSLKELNAKWGTLFPVEFPTWNDVIPPPPDEHLSCRARRLDWLEFVETRLEEQVSRVADLVREVDPSHPTSLNVMGVHARDFTKIKVDQSGISAYVERDQYNPREIHQWVNVYMQSARVGRRPEEKIRIIETDSGPRSLSSRRPGCQDLAEVRDWAFIAQGAGMILSFMYRCRITGGHACQASMTGWDGSLTKRLERAGRRAKIIKRDGDRILAAHHFPGQLGVSHDMKMFRLSTVEGHLPPGKDYCMSSRDHGMMLARDAGFSADYVMDAELLNGSAKRFKALLFPFCTYVSPELGAAIADYVRNGGVAVAEAPFAVKDHECRLHWEKTPGCGLDEVFGFKAVDMLVFDDDERITMEDGRLLRAASDFREALEPAPKTEVLGRFADGEPAVVSHRYGKGRTLFFASMISRTYGWESRVARDVVRRFIEEHAGVTPLYRLEANPEFEPSLGAVGVDPVTVDGNSYDGVYVTNFNKQPVKCRLELPAERLKTGTFVDLISQRRFQTKMNDAAGALELALEGQQALALFSA